MDYKKVIETWLREYNDLTIQLNSYKTLYAELLLQVKNGDAIAYDKDKLSPSYKFSSDTENKAIELAILSTKVNHLDNKITVVNEGIKQLNEKERNIIELRYMQTNKWDRQLTWVQIARITKYDERWCKEIRSRAINNLALVMFGIEHENSLNTPLLEGKQVI